jgi:hypothetical protein
MRHRHVAHHPASASADVGAEHHVPCTIEEANASPSIHHDGHLTPSPGQRFLEHFAVRQLSEERFAVTREWLNPETSLWSVRAVEPVMHRTADDAIGEAKRSTRDWNAAAEDHRQDGIEAQRAEEREIQRQDRLAEERY